MKDIQKADFLQTEALPKIRTEALPSSDTPFSESNFVLKSISRAYKLALDLIEYIRCVRTIEVAHAMYGDPQVGLVMGWCAGGVAWGVGSIISVRRWPRRAFDSAQCFIAYAAAGTVGLPD